MAMNKNFLLKLGAITTLSLTLASCILPPAPRGTTSTNPQQTVSASSLTSEDKVFLKTLYSNKLSVNELQNALATRTSPYVRNEIIFKLTEALVAENKNEAAAYYLKQYVTSSEQKQKTQFSYLAAKVGQLTNDQELLAKAGNIDATQLSVDQKVPAAKLALVNAFNRNQYDEGLYSINSVINQVNDASRQELVDFTTDKLAQLGTDRLQSLISMGERNTGWYSLGFAVASAGASTSNLVTNYHNWASDYPGHAAAVNPPRIVHQSSTASAVKYRNVTVLLPFEQGYTTFSNAIRAGLDQANIDAENSANVAYIDTAKESVSAAVERVAANSDIIIGPLKRDNVQALSNSSLRIPQLMLNQGESTNPNACYITMQIEHEAATIAKVMASNKYRNPIIVSDNSSSSQRAANEFKRVWLQLKQENVKTIGFSNANAANVARNLLNTTPTPSAILFLGNDKGLLALNGALKLVKADHKLQIFATNKSNTELFSSSTLNDLANVYFTDATTVADTSSPIAKKAARVVDNSYTLRRLYAFGYDAFNIGQHYADLRNVSNYVYNGVIGRYIIPSDGSCNVQLYFNVYKVEKGNFVKVN